MQAKLYTIVDEYGIYKATRTGKVLEESGIGDGPDAGFAFYPPDLESGEQVAYSAPPTDEPGKWKYLDGGWKEYTAEDAKLARTAEIKSRLLEIDLESVRPLRAKAYGTATPEDDAKLAALEQEAEALRAELAGVGG